METDNSIFNTPIKIKEPQNKLPDFSVEDLPPHLQETLKELGWAELMPVQKKTVPYMLQGRDMLIQSKTGSGKTGAFLLPLLQVIIPEHIFPQALILVPTRELALQVHGEAEKLSKGLGIRSCVIFGGVGFENQIRNLRNGVHIIVATPGRLLDHAQRGNVDFNSIRDLIMDEADEMLGMGFYPDMQRIRRYLPRQISCTMFSATIPQTVKSLAREFQRPNADFLSLSYDQVIAKNLEHRYYAADAMGKDSLLIKILEWENPESCMIFCNMKKDIAYLEQILRNYGFAVEALSGDISQAERERVLGEFRENKLKLLLCTDVAARGIDISHVSHIVVYDHPGDREVYVHRSGRTARAGRSGLAISLITPVEEIEIQKTAADFGINFIKMPPINEEELASRIRQRAEAKLDRERRHLGQKQNERMRRYLPLVEELSQNTEGKELLAYLLDSYYWK
ncbi:MAG: DEAD/DEAH box helicase [Fibromonadaceae bacterium]|jgi:ATP-dependent RNA helicase DeaD|nr:DEAD/DEAH box helicase [Fibromonadaceae bacterium]